jgi:hypothetical protein
MDPPIDPPMDPPIDPPASKKCPGVSCECRGENRWCNIDLTIPPIDLNIEVLCENCRGEGNWCAPEDVEPIILNYEVIFCDNTNCNNFVPHHIYLYLMTILDANKRVFKRKK